MPTAQTTTTTTGPSLTLIREIIEACPRRVAGSEDERRGHEILQRELQAAGLRTELLPFRFGTHLYAGLALYSAFALLGLLLLPWSPPAAALLHAFVAFSLWAEVSRRGYVLRRILPWRASQNLLGVRPASGEPTLRLVLLAHVDAAYTGWAFHPAVIRAVTNRPLPRPLRFFRKMMRLPLVTLVALFVLDLVALYRGPTPWLWGLAWLIAAPLVLNLVLNLQIVLRNEIVPGANDNLSACAALPILARRLIPDLPEDVELVCVVTGAEEAGTGGAYQLVRAKEREWSRATTIAISLDGLSNGELRYFIEGELADYPPPPWLESIARRVELPGSPGSGIQPFPLVAGATDLLPFLARGYDGLSLGCVDPTIGAPRHYHRPTDDADHLDPDQLARSIDAAEHLIREVVRSGPTRLRTSS